MNTPICDFVKKYADKGGLRLHMPGHKGISESLLGIERLDITEIEGADVLYSGDGIIAKSQKNASKLFGSRKTLYSTEGSSLSIRAMIYLANLHALHLGKKAKILAGRNAHKTFLSAIALLDVEVEWIYPEGIESVMSCKIDAENIRKYLSQCEEKPTAVYITSPDYLGNTSDIEKIAQVCHEQGALLLVDNAHGAYLKFLPEDKHPITLGADICCDSAHKTLPVLTGGGYLHIGGSAPEHIVDGAEQAMSLFASTSPSYLVMQSLDRANLYLSDGYREKLAATVEKFDILKKKLIDKGLLLVGNEKLKLTVAPKSYGYTGEEAAAILQDSGIVCELYDPDHVVMMLTPEIDDCGLVRLEEALLSLERREPITETPPAIPRCERATNIRQAMLSPSHEVKVSDACGEILAAPSVSCPPAVPILVCGEKITPDAIKCFEYYGIDKVRVLI